MAEEFIDQVARDKVNDTAHALANHVAVTGIKIDNIDHKFDQLQSQLKWAGGLIVSLFLAALAWSLGQQYSANESTKKDLSAQVELLKEQRRSSVAARADRQIIMERLSPSGTETLDSTEGGGK